MQNNLKNPLVSIIIPTYKRAQYLERAINSVLTQTYKNIEVIIVDDNNANDQYREETERIMIKYKKNSRIKYLKHKLNKNGSFARNTGIQHSKGEYIGFLDDDDFYLPNKVKKQVDKLESLGRDWGGSCCWHVRRYKNYTYKKIKVEKNDNGNYCSDFLAGKTSMPSSTLLFRSEIFEKVGRFDVTFERHQDWEFLVRFYRYYKMSVLEEFAMYMQVEGYRNYPSADKAFEIKKKFLETFNDDIFKLPPNVISSILHFQWFDITCLFIKERNYRTAIRLWVKNVYPNSKSNLKDLLNVTFFLLNGLFPSFKVLFYIMIGSTINRRYRMS